MQDFEPVVRRYLYNLRKTQYLPPDRLLAYQRALLDQLVRHARANVPFYRDTGRLDVLFRRDDTIDWERWAEVPLLRRSDVQRVGAALRSTTHKPEHGRTFETSTSGSTGEPVTVLHSEYDWEMAYGSILLRDFERHGFDPKRRLAYLAPFAPTEFDITTARRQDAWFPQLKSLGFVGERFDLADTRPAADLIDDVASLRPDYLRVQPIVLELLCAHDREARLSKLGLRAALTVGEHLSPDAKRLAERHLGCPILEVYGSAECGLMAATCASCHRFHVHAEVNFLEVVGVDNAPTRPGETGWIVATPLYSYAMPLIRYDHADQAIVGIPEACSIRLPTLEAVHGKERVPFVFPDGHAIRPSFPTRRIVEYLGAQACQFAQIAPDTCEVRVVPGRLAPSQMRLQEMTQTIRAMWWDGLKVDYRFFDQIPRRSPRGKLAQFVREFAPTRPDGAN